MLSMAKFISVSGTTGEPFYVNGDFVRSIRPSKQAGMSRLLMESPDGSEVAISVHGTPRELADMFNGSGGKTA